MPLKKRLSRKSPSPRKRTKEREFEDLLRRAAAQAKFPQPRRVTSVSRRRKTA